jgi:hypothetical protein
MARKLWIKGAIKRPGALRAKAKGAGALKDGISHAWLVKKAASLKAKAKGKKKLTAEELRLLRQINLALRLKKMPKRGRK